MIAKFVKAKGYKVHSGVSVGCCVCVQTPLSLDCSDERLSLKSQLHVLRYDHTAIKQIIFIMLFSICLQEQSKAI